MDQGGCIPLARVQRRRCGQRKRRACGYRHRVIEKDNDFWSQGYRRKRTTLWAYSRRYLLIQSFIVAMAGSVRSKRRPTIFSERRTQHTWAGTEMSGDAGRLNVT